MSEPRLATSRLVLRAPGVADAAAIREYFVRNAARFERWDPPRASETSVYERWIAELHAAARTNGYVSQFVAFELARDAETEPVATVALTSFERSEPGASISYTLDAGLEGRGYASEAVGAVADYAFATLGLRSLYAYVDPENARSAALLRRAGFTELARLPALPGPGALVRAQVLWRLRGAGPL